jgi:ABC-2 type transport system ATP-binding protein
MDSDQHHRRRPTFQDKVRKNIMNTANNHANTNGHLDNLVSVENLTRTFGEQSVLKDLTFTLPHTGTIGLIGRNGAGKTTLMGILAGQLRHTGGHVTVGGDVPFDNGAAMNRVCFTGADVLYPPRWTISTVLSIAEQRYPFWDKGLAGHLARTIGLSGMKKMSELSTGQRSLVSVVVGLASRAPLTLLDEPYSGLDVQNRRLFYQVLAELQDDDPRCILLSTHQLSDAGRLVDRLLILGEDGALAHDLTSEAFLDRVVRLTGSAARMQEVLTQAQDDPTVTVTGVREVAGTTAVDVDLGTREIGELEEAVGRGISVEPLGVEDSVIALTGGAS